jgi:hypothetical protein
MSDRPKCQFIGACFMALHESPGKFRILASVQRRAASGKKRDFLVARKIRPAPRCLHIPSEQLGAAIGPALRSISDSIRSRHRLYAEEAAQKTTIKILSRWY